MQTIGDSQPFDPDKLRRIEEFYSQEVPSDQHANKDRSTQIEDLEDSDYFSEWLRKRQQGTNLDPMKQRVPVQASPQSDYLIELTRLRDPNTPSSLSNLTVPDVDISSINSVASTPAQTLSRRLITLSPRARRSSGLRMTPRAIVQQKQIKKANQNLAEHETFNPTASSTPCIDSKKPNFLSKLSLARPDNEINSVYSSDEPSSIQISATNGTKQNSKNHENELNKIAVEPVSTSQNDKTLVPCTQEQPNEMQSNEDEIVIPETQDTEEQQQQSITNPVQAPVNNNDSLQSPLQQQTNQQQTETNIMRTPSNGTKGGVKPAWANTLPSTPKSAKNQSSRLPFWRKTPRTDTVEKRSSVVVQETTTTQPNVLELTPTKANRNTSNNSNNSFGRTLVVAVTNPSTLSAPSTVAMPSIQLNVNINGSMPQSSQLNGAAEQIGTASKTVELDQRPSAINGSNGSDGSNESIMTNDSDPLSDEVDKENHQIVIPRLDHTENVPARKQLIRNFGLIELETSPGRQPIDNRTHTINNESAFESLHSKSKRSTGSQALCVDSIRSNGSNVLPPIDSRTFDKQQSTVGNATYDLCKHGISTQASMNTFTNDSTGVSKRRNTIDVSDEASAAEPIFDLTIDTSYDTDDADAEVAQVTGLPETNTPNGSTNHNANLNDADEILEPSQDSDHHVGTHKEGTQLGMNEKIAEKIQSQINKSGKTPAAFNPVVVLTQLPADILSQSHISTNRLQSRVDIRESESFSHMIPPIEFRDEPIIREKSPQSALRDFSVDQTQPVKPPKLSQTKKKRKKNSVNPELEAINRTYAEIHQRRSSSPKRASKGRKLFTHRSEDAEHADNVSTNAQTSTDSGKNDVFKKPLAPLPRRLRLSKTSSANQSSNSVNESEINASRTDSPVDFDPPISPDKGISAKSRTQLGSTTRPAENEMADQLNDEEPIEMATNQAKQLPKRRLKTTRTMRKPRSKNSSVHAKTNISLSNIIEDCEVERNPGRSKRDPTSNSMKKHGIQQLTIYYTGNAGKRKLSHAPSSTVAHKRPKLSENHSRSSSKEFFKHGLTDEYIKKRILQQQWWKNFSNMTKARKISQDENEADLDIRKVGEGQRVESVCLDSIEFQKISDSFDIGIVPTEQETRVHGFMRLKPTAIKEEALAENDTHFYIFNGEIVLNAENQTLELIGGDTFLIKAGTEYEIQNVGKDVCILSFIYHKN